MEENLQMVELEKSLIHLKQIREKMTKTLESFNGIVRDNINSGIGVWDSEMARLYRERWEQLMETFPEILKIFATQETNLEQYLQNMKKVEER